MASAGDVFEIALVFMFGGAIIFRWGHGVAREAVREDQASRQPDESTEKV